MTAVCGERVGDRDGREHHSGPGWVPSSYLGAKYKGHAEGSPGGKVGRVIGFRCVEGQPPSPQPLALIVTLTALSPAARHAAPHSVPTLPSVATITPHVAAPRSPEPNAHRSTGRRGLEVGAQHPQFRPAPPTDARCVPDSASQWGGKTPSSPAAAPGFAHPVALHRALPPTDSSRLDLTPAPGSCQGTPSRRGRRWPWRWLFICRLPFLSRTFPPGSVPSEFYFSAQKNLTSIPKKDKTTETQI